MKQTKITAKMLEEKGACRSEVERFKAEWEDGVEVTLANAIRATELHFDLDWLADNFLSAPAVEVYGKAITPAWEAYGKAITQDKKAYGKATAPAWEAYGKATAPAWEAYGKATAPAWEAYEKATATAWEAYEKAKATALYEVWQVF